MNDYKELIGDIRICLIAQPNQALYKQLLREAVDAIVQLVNDRNASVDALKAIEDVICSHGERKDEVSEQ